jgi:hypothetical protein
VIGLHCHNYASTTVYGVLQQPLPALVYSLHIFRPATIYVTDPDLNSTVLFPHFLNLTTIALMAPEITHFHDLDFVAESFDPATSEFLYTTFAVIDRDDTVYFGQLAIPKLKITFKQYTSALVQLPDSEIYAEFPQGGELTAAPYELTSNLYLKRPRLFQYEEYKAEDCVDIIPALLLEEAHTLEAISKHPHPGIVGYHGCRVRRCFVTGLVLDRHVSDLKHYVRDHMGPLDNGSFMAALESAIYHLHSVGLAHNDVNPSNTHLGQRYWHAGPR